MRKRYSEAFKAQVVLELLKEDKTVAQIASEYHVYPTQLNEWKATALAGLPSLFTRERKARANWLKKTGIETCGRWVFADI